MPLNLTTTGSKSEFSIRFLLAANISGGFARWLSKAIIKLCEKRKMDITLSKFLGNFVKILVLVFVLIIAMGKFGISIAPFIALLGALAFGASFALQGPLSNYGAGLTIILARPFVVGDTITVKNVSGIVDEVTLATTILSTEDGEKITIPNKHIVGEILNNSFANKVVENAVRISYDDDPEKAINIIKETLKQFTRSAFRNSPIHPLTSVCVTGFLPNNILEPSTRSTWLYIKHWLQLK
jgi:small conductance mechanosensitive channel